MGDDSVAVRGKRFEQIDGQGLVLVESSQYENQSLYGHPQSKGVELSLIVASHPYPRHLLRSFGHIRSLQ